MRDRLIELLCNIKCEGEEEFGNCPHRVGQKCNKVQRLEMCSIFAIADHLIANKVFVLPEQMNDSWELALPFIMRLFVADEAEIEKIKGEFECQKVKQILTDIRDYLLRGKLVFEKTTDFESVLFGAGVQVFIDKALSDLTEYAEKMGVEL